MTDTTTERIQAIHRYDLVEYGGYYRDHQMDKAADGEWARWDDIEPLLRAYVSREAGIKALVDACEDEGHVADATHLCPICQALAIIADGPKEELSTPR